MSAIETFPPLPADDLDRGLAIATPDAGDARHISLAGGSYIILVSGAQTAGRSR